MLPWPLAKYLFFHANAIYSYLAPKGRSRTDWQLLVNWLRHFATSVIS